MTKGAGLDFLAEHMGFTQEQTIAFGDGENDVELVEWPALRRRGRERARAREGGRRAGSARRRGGEGVAQVIEALLRLDKR